MKRLFKWKNDFSETKEYRIIQEIDGFRIQKKNICSSTKFFGIIKRKTIHWYYIKTKLDSDTLFPYKTKPFVTLDGIKAELERIKDFPKYY